VLVTGISGLIGTRIIEAFSADYPIVGLDVKPVQMRTGEVDWIKCDLTNDASARDALTTVRERHGDRLASVIHLAAYYAIFRRAQPPVPEAHRTIRRDSTPGKQAKSLRNSQSSYIESCRPVPLSN
jgi:nucleoside-diphosphate-sugar epimerase